jgi:hypothetical protein
MMKSGSFEPIIDILIESSARNSLLNSAVLEMLQYIYKGKKSVIIHIVEMYGERFKTIETFGIVDEINKRYAQLHDTSTVTASAGGEIIDRHQQPNGAVRWGPGIKEMDATEEDYFDRDEDESLPVEPLPADDELGVEKPFELKRRRSPDDEGEDQLLQLAQRSPPAKENADNSNGTKTSSSPPSSSPVPDRVLREKRPRDTDEQDDEIDRLSRSSKRVVSPTDVKRKPARGALNGGRKIAISLGKK